MPVGHLGDADDGPAEPRTVRPYTVTGGRTRPSTGTLALEALVRATDPAAGADAGAVGTEARQILRRTATGYVSVAELSAHLHLPLGVVRVLVGDLAQSGLVSVHGAPEAPGASPLADPSLLESILNGITAL